MSTKKLLKGNPKAASINVAQAQAAISGNAQRAIADYKNFVFLAKHFVTQAEIVANIANALKGNG